MLRKGRPNLSSILCNDPSSLSIAVPIPHFLKDPAKMRPAPDFRTHSPPQKFGGKNERGRKFVCAAFIPRCPLAPSRVPKAQGRRHCKVNTKIISPSRLPPSPSYFLSHFSPKGKEKELDSSLLFRPASKASRFSSSLGFAAQEDPVFFLPLNPEGRQNLTSS